MTHPSRPEPTRSLPVNPSLAQLKKQAKELLRAYRRGEAEAVSEVRSYERESEPATFGLQDAQRVLARAYGFQSWSRLKDRVDQIDAAAMQKAVQARDLRQVRQLLRRRPELVHMNWSGNAEYRPLHYAVLNSDQEMTRLLMEHGADARQGIHPHREATTALTLANERGLDKIMAIIAAEERRRHQTLRGANSEIQPGQDRLHRLILEGNAGEANAMMTADPGLIHACDQSGASPLHAAAAALNVELVESLLAQGADARQQDAEGRTPIDHAVLGVGWRSRARADLYPAIAGALRRSGCECTPLAATASGDLERLRWFSVHKPKRLTHGYEWNHGGLISVAVTFGRMDALRLLLDLGLDPNEPLRVGEVEEESCFSVGRPLWLAAAFGEYEMAELLLERGADANGNVYASGWPIDRAYDTGDAAMRDLLVRHGADLRASTVGHNRDVDGARRLLARARDVIEDVTSYDCRTVVEELLWAGACGGSPEIVRLCLPEIDRAPDDPWWHGILVQPLYIWNHGPHRPPVRHDRSTYPTCLQLMLEHGADPNVRGALGRRLLHDVAALGTIWGKPVMQPDERLAFARLLLDAGARQDVRDEILESTPLGWACRWGRVELVALHLERGAPANEPDARPWATPLAWATKMGHEAIVQRLRAQGAER